MSNTTDDTNDKTIVSVLKVKTYRYIIMYVTDQPIRLTAILAIMSVSAFVAAVIV